MTRIIIQGINGRMGKVLCELIEQREDCRVVGGVDAAGDDAITVYAERATEQLEGYEEGQSFSMSFTMHDSSVLERDIPLFGKQEIALETDISVTQNYVLGGTVRNPLHMAVRDDPSYTDDPASDDEEDDEREYAVALLSRDERDDAEKQRSDDGRKASKHVEEAVELGALLLGDQTRIVGAGERLDPALEEPYADREDVELHDACHEEPEACDDDISRDSDQERPPDADPVAEEAIQQR